MEKTTKTESLYGIKKRLFNYFPNGFFLSVKLLILSTLTTSTSSLLAQSDDNCSCGYYINSFCAGTPQWTDDFNIIAAKVTEPHHGTQYMTVDVVEQLVGDMSYDSITILGQDGWNCGELLNPFGLGDELILSLYPAVFDPADNDTFYLDGCVLTWLRINEGMVEGNIFESPSSMDYEVFKEDFMNCLDFTVSTDEVDVIEDGFSLQPNPVENEILIRSENLLIEKVVIFSVQGHLLMEKDIPKQNEMQLNLKDWEAGIYLVSIQTKTESIVKRIVVQ